VLYWAQEMTIRLAVERRLGISAFVRAEYGKVAGWVVAVPLITTCVTAIISEVSSMASAFEIVGVPIWASVLCISLFLLLLICTGSFRLAEKVGLTVGCFQLVFLVTCFMAKPGFFDILDGFGHFPISNPSYSQLVTANIGGVIMPWMLAYQQSAVALKAPPKSELRNMRLETAFGSVLTQAVMAAVLVTTAAMLPRGTSLSDAKGLAQVLGQILGNEAWGSAVTIFGACGGSMVAAIVVLLCAAWTVEEASTGGLGRAEQTDVTLMERLRERPGYYATAFASVALAAVITFREDDIVALNVFIEVLNGVLMPPVVLALWLLASFRLDADTRLSGCGRLWKGLAFLVCSVFCIASLFQPQ